MSIKISQLPMATFVNDATLVPIVQNTTTQTANLGVMSSFIISSAITIVPISATAPGDFTTTHGLSVTPLTAIIQMTSNGSIWFQPSPSFDSTNLYLVSSGGNITNPLTANVIVISV